VIGDHHRRSRRRNPFELRRIQGEVDLHDLERMRRELGRGAMLMGAGDRRLASARWHHENVKMGRGSRQKSRLLPAATKLLLRKKRRRRLFSNEQVNACSIPF
jgi:hypothetical protein